MANDAAPRVVRRIIVDTNSRYYARTLYEGIMQLENYVILSAFLTRALASERASEARIVETAGVRACVKETCTKYRRRGRRYY